MNNGFGILRISCRKDNWSKTAWKGIVSDRIEYELWWTLWRIYIRLKIHKWTGYNLAIIHKRCLYWELASEVVVQDFGTSFEIREPGLQTTLPLISSDLMEITCIPWISFFLSLKYPKWYIPYSATVRIKWDKMYKNVYYNIWHFTMPVTWLSKCNLTSVFVIIIINNKDRSGVINIGDDAWKSSH